jgi:ubiquinone/menaquinone biosynthesis C-methylase UbiE
LDNIDTFSNQSDHYARHRPTYPRELFAYLSDLTTQHERAWDCATGNGQAAVQMAAFFEQIDATDISEEQIRHASPHPRVTYRVCPAEHTPFPARSFDLIVVAQAYHWFDQERFQAESLRVLKPGGVLAVFGYGFCQIDPEIDAIVDRTLLAPIDPFWAEGNRLIMAGYRTLSLPVDEIPDPPTFAIRLQWTMDRFLAYLRTWSAVKLYKAEFGRDPVERLADELSPIWATPEDAKLVTMPLALRVGRAGAR